MSLLLPFLKIDETFAFFQFVNWTPSLELKFITAVMEGAKTSAHSSRTNLGSLSGPGALYTSSELSTFEISSTVTLM